MFQIMSSSIGSLRNASCLSILRGLSSKASKPGLIVKEKKKTKKGISARQEYYITNKDIFGPLVETAREKKRKKRPQPDANASSSQFVELASHSPPKTEYHDGGEIAIDKSKWDNKVPSYINISEILNHPLYYEVKRNDALDVNSEIQSINMFEGGYQKLPSVRKILDETQTIERKAILERWKKNMIKKLGLEEFEIYQQRLLDRGSIMHGCLELTLRQQVEPSPEQLVGIEHLWASVGHVLPKVSQVRIVESRVIHPYLFYQGAIDCLATYKNKLVLIEFKTSTKPKLTLQATYDDPLQLIAYLGALNYDGNYSIPQVEGALLVVAYPTGLPAHVHLLTHDDLQKYWRMWCKRLAQYWALQAL